jgi:pimeloyl-ACP methyl ester carboxylesterase
MERHYFHHDGLRFSYLDSCGNNPALVALHAHFMESVTYASLADALPGWRVVALDQRGHGYTDHAQSYARVDYIEDLKALFEHANLNQAVVLGNSLGGANAYQFAARYSNLVRGLIVEDLFAEVRDDITFALAWEGEFPTREALAARVGPRFLPYLEASFREESGSWRLAFNPSEMVESQKLLCGDHWNDWLATTCPALLLRGRESRVTTQAGMEQMVTRRPNARLVTLDGGHILHFDNPTDFVDSVRDFLQQF